jgi:hypothetical protein
MEYSSTIPPPPPTPQPQSGEIHVENAVRGGVGRRRTRMGAGTS